MRTYLLSAALLLCIANLFVLPNTVSAFSRQVQNNIYGGCGCSGSAGPLAGLDISEGVLLAQNGGEMPLTPACPNGCGPGLEVFYYACVEVEYFCDAENPSSGLDDQKFKHGYRKYFCPGQTWYSCHGYSWVLEGCCKGAQSWSLPIGCNPPHGPTDRECNT